MSKPIWQTNNNQNNGGSLVAIAALGLMVPVLSAANLPAEHDAMPSADQIAAKMMQAEDTQRSALKEYSVTRRYVLQNKRFGKSGEMVVKALYRQGEGKTFQVLAVTGSADVGRRVFDKLLDMEAETSKNERIDPSRMTTDNYGFKLAGVENMQGYKCYVLEVSPKKKNKYLLEGKIWVNAADYAIIRVDGRPAASLGFWVGRPHIEQTFQKVGDFWVSARNHSVADTRLLGTTELKIDYSGYEFSVPENVRVAMRQQPHRAREFVTE